MPDSSHVNTLAPDYRLTVDGTDITPKAAGRLIELTLDDNREGEADTLSITLSDHDNKLAIPPHGAEIQCAIGWKGKALVDKGLFTVDESTYAGSPDKLTISARSANFRPDLPGKKSRSWHKKTLGDIVTQVASEHKLTPIISAELKGIRIGNVQQTAETDINVLTRLADTHGALVNVKSGKLLFLTKGSGTAVSGSELPNTVIHKSQCQENYSYSQTDKGAYTGVKAKWNNVAGSKYEYVIAGSTDQLTEMHNTYASAAEALAAAKAELKRIQSGKATLSLTLAQGDPELIAEAPVQCTGFKQQINDTKWICKNITHNMNESGLTTSINCETAAE